MKRFKHEFPQSNPPYGWKIRWMVYEADAKRAIEEAYLRGMRDGRECERVANEVRSKRS